MMDRAHALPEYIGNIVREEFYSQKARDQHIESPSICRLYFGKVLRPSQFVNPINFPLDVDRYTTLRGHCQEGDLLSAAEVAEGMGEMLGSIHWLSGFDGRDIEFIMAGTGISIRYYVVDFNQMRRLNVHQDNIQDLVDSFFSNDPYYPRPNPIDSLYIDFRTAYLNRCPEQHRLKAQRFLAAIESRYVPAA